VRVLPGKERCFQWKQYLGDRDKGKVDANEGNICRQVGRAQVADIEFIPNNDPRIRLEFPIQLPMADVKSMHSGGAILKKAIGEAAGRSAQIGAHPAGNPDLEMIQRRLQFGACPAGKLKLAENADPGVDIHLLAGLLDLLFIHQNPARKQQSLGFVPALGKSAFHQQLIDASSHQFRQCD